MSPLRLGVVSYLNAVPLVHWLESDPAFELLRDVPSRVAERLHAGDVHLGMIPSIEYARGDYAIVPGVGITSRGPVRSVCLFLKKPLADVRRVALDTSSRTSVALARLLLRAERGEDPEYLPMPPSVTDMLGVADASLVIGDPALYYEGEAVRLASGPGGRTSPACPSCGPCGRAAQVRSARRRWRGCRRRSSAAGSRSARSGTNRQS